MLVVVGVTQTRSVGIGSRRARRALWPLGTPALRFLLSRCPARPPPGLLEVGGSCVHMGMVASPVARGVMKGGASMACGRGWPVVAGAWVLAFHIIHPFAIRSES